jgi:hypothetical protein
MSEGGPPIQAPTNTIQGDLGLNITPWTSATYDDPREAEHKRQEVAAEAENRRKEEAPRQNTAGRLNSQN